jgi:hypothetical protein
MILLRRPSLFILLAAICFVSLQTANAQQPAPTNPPVTVVPEAPANAAPLQPGSTELPPPDKRVFGVLPNYRTANFTAEYHPITPKQKITIALKDSFDYPLMGVGALYASLYQLEDSHPQFGQGIKGYLRRFGTSYSDQVIGNMLTEGILPIAFHEDPRYFRIGAGGGSVRHRTWYALTRILVTRTDTGGKTFNFAEIIGNGSGTLIGWSYYTDTRDAPDYFQAFGTALATDAISQVLKEFWPDIKHKYFHHDKPAGTD